MCILESLLAGYHPVHLISTPDAGAQALGLFVGSCCPVLECTLPRMLLEGGVLTRPKAAAFQHLGYFLSSQSMLLPFIVLVMWGVGPEPLQAAASLPLHPEAVQSPWAHEEGEHHVHPNFSAILVLPSQRTPYISLSLIFIWFFSLL